MAKKHNLTFEKFLKKKYLKVIRIGKFKRRCGKLLQNSNELNDEFLYLAYKSSKMIPMHNIAQLPSNINKNRYADILPYDSTRVILQDCDFTSSYINASYIEDSLNSNVKYIACQAPLLETCVHFWKMIYQHQVQTIVMLCNFIENGKIKCHNYLPNENNTLVFEDMSVICTQIKETDEYIKRTLTLTKGDQDTPLTISHFHFNTWPDKGVPSTPESLLHFCRAVRASSDANGITVVHCSAGAGRTGTYIAVDLLLQHLEYNYKLSVFKTVLNMRQQRPFMVKSIKQYGYIYTCLRHVLDSPEEYLEKGKEEIPQLNLKNEE